MTTMGRKAMVGVVAALGVTLAGNAMAQEFKLRFHHFSSPRGYDGKVMVPKVIDELRKASKGRIKVQIFPGMQLGGRPSALVDQVTDGVVDLVYTLPGYTAGRFPMLAGLELPFLGIAGAEATTRLAWDFYDKYAKADFKGFRPMSITMTDAGLLHTSKKKVVKIDDLKGLKLRVASRYIGVAVQNMGGVPVQMPLPAVYESLARGQVQGMMIPFMIMRPFKLFDVTKYHLEMPIYHSVLLQVMSNKSYAKLPKDLRTAIDGIDIRGISHWIAQGQDREGRAARAYGVKKGAKITTLGGPALNAWMSRAKPAQQAWAKEMTKRGHDGDAMLAFLLTTAKKYKSTN